MSSRVEHLLSSKLLLDYQVRLEKRTLNHTAARLGLNNHPGRKYHWLHKWMNSCLLLPAGYFLLEPWDQRKSSNSPHLGVTVTVRDPNHEVVHSKESYITVPRPHKQTFNRRLKHVITAFAIKIRAKLLLTILHKFSKGKRDKGPFIN